MRTRPHAQKRFAYNCRALASAALAGLGCLHSELRRERIQFDFNFMLCRLCARTSAPTIISSCTRASNKHGHATRTTHARARAHVTNRWNKLLLLYTPLTRVLRHVSSNCLRSNSNRRGPDNGITITTQYSTVLEWNCSDTVSVILLPPLRTFTSYRGRLEFQPLHLPRKNCFGFARITP